ncbi:MAG TPA: LLM class flavin-dependent oxidoreductase, partial [Ilumatobacteraceae bacterium]|nr:LLM class flavin-dependent oxidoreductase [Ilumatobacteraceae bacterium]
MYTVATGRRIVGMQVPVQTLSKSSSEPWERGASVADMGRAARQADAAGFDYLAVCDHVAIPEAVVEHNSTHWVDPIGTLGWLAAQTQRAMLLTHVYVVPFRHPRVAAKQFVTLDWLSGGRLICGVGVGHMVEEFAGLGVDYHRRGQLTNDGIKAIAKLMEHEWVDGLGVAPRPVQTPGPPIWVAGSSVPAVRRAALL